MTSAPNYLCVFRANPEISNNVVDLGQDPDFQPPVATWGICRPPTRQSVRIGSYVVFLGYYPRYPIDHRYLVKGWIRVGEKIGYLEALERFPDRPNVIIRDNASIQSHGSISRGWRRADLQEETERRYGTDEPDFLTKIQLNDRILVQSPCDYHEIDNWKCQRMFRCQKSRLAGCIRSGRCVREGQFPELRGYIVAAPDGWQDVGPLRLDWQEVAPDHLRSRRLRTPRGQHNALRLSDDDVEAIIRGVRFLSSGSQ
jgi:hypothetical protein